VPDPDNSLSKRSEDQLKQLRTDLTKNGMTGIFRKVIYTIMYIFYFPYTYPATGLAISVLMIISIVFI